VQLFLHELKILEILRNFPKPHFAQYWPYPLLDPFNYNFLFLFVFFHLFSNYYLFKPFLNFHNFEYIAKSLGYSRPIFDFSPITLNRGCINLVFLIDFCGFEPT
jgi:hypothetical protein